MLKNFTQFFLIFLSALVMSSCSNSQKLTQSDDSPSPIRYRKVYEGNKIIYKSEAKEIKLNTSSERLAQIELEPEAIVPLEKPKTDKHSGLASLLQKVSGQAGSGNGQLGFNELSQLLSSRFEVLSDIGEGKPSATTDESADTHALVGFILSVVAIISLFVGSPVLGILGLLAAIAGLVLSIMGLKSDTNKALAIIGLVLSILYFVLFLVALILVASFLAGGG